jgi:hypothetical protein
MRSTYCICIPPLIARQRLSIYIPATTNRELLNACFPCGPRGSTAANSSQNFLVFYDDTFCVLSMIPHRQLDITTSGVESLRATFCPFCMCLMRESCKTSRERRSRPRAHGHDVYLFAISFAWIRHCSCQFQYTKEHDTEVSSDIEPFIAVQYCLWNELWNHCTNGNFKAFTCTSWRKCPGLHDKECSKCGALGCDTVRTVGRHRRFEGTCCLCFQNRIEWPFVKATCLYKSWSHQTLLTACSTALSHSRSRYRDGLRVRFPAGENLFSFPQRPDRGPTQPAIQWMPKVKQSGRETDHSLQSSPDVKNGGAIPPLSHTPS